MHCVCNVYIVHKITDNCSRMNYDLHNYNKKDNKIIIIIIIPKQYNMNQQLQVSTLFT